MRPAREIARVAVARGLASARSRRGLTLVELMVVIAIITVLMGVGVGVWASFRSGSARERAYRSLVTACRRAKVFSIEEGASSRLTIFRPKSGTHGLQASGMRLVGFWHLETSSDPGRPDGPDPLEGFAGRMLEQVGGVFSDDKGVIPGRRGTGICFQKGGSIILPAGAMRLPRGGQISFYLRPVLVDQKQNLLTRGRELEMTLGSDGRIEAQVGSVIIATDGFRLAPERWSRVALSYGPEAVTISVDGVVRARNAADEEVELPDAKELDLPLEIGSGEWQIFGTVDEIAVHRSVREGMIILPQDIKILGDVDELRFEGGGMLDRRFHNGPVRLGLAAPKEEGRTSVHWVTIDLMGNIREDR